MLACKNGNENPIWSWNDSPAHPSDPDPLIGFYLFLRMGYVGSTQLFYMATQTASDITNTSYPTATNAPHHPLNCISDMPSSSTDGVALGFPAKDFDLNLHDLCWGLLTRNAAELLNYVDVYMENVCPLSHGSARVH